MQVFKPLDEMLIHFALLKQVLITGWLRYHAAKGLRNTWKLKQFLKFSSDYALSDPIELLLSTSSTEGKSSFP